MTRAKIVATLGPASAGPQRVRDLVDAGMDVARLNLSHGTHEDHEAAYLAVRSAGDATGRSVGVLVDLQGPKIRLGRFANGPVTITVGDEFVITTDDVPGDRHIVSTTYRGLPGDVHPGRGSCSTTAASLSRSSPLPALGSSCRIYSSLPRPSDTM